MYQIEITNKQTHFTEHLSKSLPIHIGRTTDNDIVLKDDEKVSRKNHAIISEQGGQLIITDNSSNGTKLNGYPLVKEQATLFQIKDTIEIGQYTLVVSLSSEGPTKAEPVSDATIIFDRKHKSTTLIEASNLTDLFQRYAVLPSAELDQYRPTHSTYLAIGAGLGSFTWIDHLVIFGANPRDIVTIGPDPKPHTRYETLCRYSQIPYHERLRSNSDSCPDNIWGWPGYGLREVWHGLTHNNLRTAGRVAWQIFAEPYFADTYTPRSGNVFDSIDRETRRIGWLNMWQDGWVQAIRKTDRGQYVVQYSYHKDDPTPRYHTADYVHIAVGYPGIKLLPDLKTYREKTGDRSKIVNAYEEHDFVYQQLERKGGTVLMRGRGIVASRVLQRLYEARQKNPKIRILHLMRRPNSEGSRYPRNRSFPQSQRYVENHWEFQPFNWPKSGWGGDLRAKLENANPNERDKMLDEWGGTTTADRSDWREIVARGIAEGWYQITFGQVENVKPQGQRIITRYKAVDQSTPGQKETFFAGSIEADFVIDATGLISDINYHPLLRDMVTTYQLQLNPQGRLSVANDFEILGLENGQGRAYASGIITLGGPYAPVDSFLGLQYAALRSVDSLVSAGAPGLNRLDGFRSLFQWIRWVLGVQP